jgi:hypothetical protein
MIGSLVAGATLLRGQGLDRGQTTTERIYHILGVPYRSGSLYPGNENDAKPIATCICSSG